MSATFFDRRPRGADDLRHAARARQQNGDLVGDVDRLLDGVGDEEERLALPRDELEQVLLELAPGLLVDGRERLVHQQHLAVDGERPREADALAHPAGQLVGEALLESGETDVADVALRDRLALRHPDAAQLQPEGDVAQHRGPGQQREVLEHEGAVRPGAGHGPAVHLDLPGRRREQPGDDLEQRRLAASRRPQHGGELPAGELERQVPQRLDLARRSWRCRAPRPRPPRAPPQSDA